MSIMKAVQQVLNEKKATKEECRDNSENKEWNKMVHENKSGPGFRNQSTATETTTRSQEKPQNGIENTVSLGLVLKTEICEEIEEKEIDISDDKVWTPFDPLGSRKEVCEEIEIDIDDVKVESPYDPLEHMLKSDSKKGKRGEIEKKEIDISDVKIESPCSVDASNYLDSSPINSKNTHEEDDLQSLNSYHAECAELNEDCKDSSTKYKSGKSARLNINKPIKNAINHAKKSAKCQGQSKLNEDSTHSSASLSKKDKTRKSAHSNISNPIESTKKSTKCQGQSELNEDCMDLTASSSRKDKSGKPAHLIINNTIKSPNNFDKKTLKKEQSQVCEECGSTFKNVTRFKEHRLSHAPVEEYPFKCDECGKKFRSNSIFKEHQLRHSGVKKFICPHCGIKKTTQQELRRHINYHTKEKLWPCSKCTSVFNCSSSLSRHNSSVHKGIRFACKYCDTSFVKRETLKQHEMRHTGELPPLITHHPKEKQWPCSKCTSVFNSKSSLSRHNSSAHKGIRFACKSCDKSFIKRESLKHHEMRHRGEMPHSCDICGKRFIQSVGLRSHMAVHKKGCEPGRSKLPVNEKVVTLVEKTTHSEGDCMESNVKTEMKTSNSS